MNNEQQPKQEPEREPEVVLLPDETEVDGIGEATDETGSHPEVGELNGDQPEKQKQPTEPPQLWVGSWLDYNNGRLHGEWIDADRETDEVWADIQAMLAASPTAKQSGEVAEEWGIFDYENFGALKVGEQETISFVTAVARGIAEHGLAFSAWADVMEEEEALAGFADSYLGEYDSMEAYAEQLIEDMGYNQLLDEALPEHVRRYTEINVAGLAQDMWLGGDVNVYQKDGGGVWLFDGR
jgi:antirestriction protein